jgi:hypothetical protein
MAQIIHNISSPNDGEGDKLRVAFDHQNQMNTELYTNKVDKLDGYGLSENNLTDELVATIESLSTNVPTLQEVLDFNHELLNGNNFQGTNAGQDQTGVNNIGLGTESGYNNSGDNVIGLGTESNINNIGLNVVSLGRGAGIGNEYSNVNLFGEVSISDADNQTVFSKDAGYSMARISYNEITADRKWELPDKSGTFALLDDTSKSEYKIASFTAENNVFYTIQGNSLTVTDPAEEIEGFGFIVYILSGLDISIGADDYNEGSLVYRSWNGSTFENKDISSMSEFTTIFNTLPTKLTKSGDTLTGDIENISTGFFQVAQGTTAQRPTTPVNGMIRYNNVTKRVEFYADDAWRNMARLSGDTFTGAISATNLSGNNTGDQNLSNLTKIVIKDTTASTAVTGTTAEQPIGTYLIPANTFNANDVLRISSFLAEKTGTTGTLTMRVKIGTTATFGSATTIATYTTGVTELWCVMLRNAITLRGGNLRTLSAGSLRQTDMTATSNVVSVITFNPAVDNYLFTSLQLSVGTDSVFQSNIHVTN